MAPYAFANAMFTTLFWLCNTTIIYYYCAINYLHLSDSKECTCIISHESMNQLDSSADLDQA